MKNIAVILASGTGSRYGSDIPKQFVKINGKTILEYSVEAFEDNLDINEIIIVITPDYYSLAYDILKRNNYKKVVNLLKGGATRKESSKIAIDSICEKEANVLIHDCARPLINQKIITECINALYLHDAVAVAVESSDTIVEIKDGVIKNTLDRKFLRRMQTPQCFKLSLIKKAHELVLNDDNFTDDCGLVLKNNLSQIFIVEGDVNNIKITYPLDYFIAEKIINS